MALIQAEPVERCDGNLFTSPILAIGVLAVLLGLTGFGVYTAFGPPSKKLDDPFDDHED